MPDIWASKSLVSSVQARKNTIEAAELNWTNPQKFSPTNKKCEMHGFRSFLNIRGFIILELFVVQKDCDAKFKKI